MKQKASDIAPIIASVIKREALPEQIVRQLLGLVRAGQLKPGDRLPAERALAADLGVGRPTLREALRALQLLGVLDIRHGGGVFVNEPGPDALLGPAHPFIDADRLGLDAIFEARRVTKARVAFTAPHRRGHDPPAQANSTNSGTSSPARVAQAVYPRLMRSRRSRDHRRRRQSDLTRAVQSPMHWAATRRRVTGTGWSGCCATIGASSNTRRA